jgi:AcrR family transcriptional regulator
MPRHKEFDRETTLQAAIRVFCSHGFEGSSLEMLLREMKISRQSMYDTFGDKAQLYLEALRRYYARSVTEFIRDLNVGGSPLAALEKALVRFAAWSEEAMKLGCMGVGAVCEFGRDDSQINGVIDSSAATISTALEDLVRQGKSMNEIRPDADERQAAQFILSVMSGMKVSARAGASVQSLQEISRYAVRSLKAP